LRIVGGYEFYPSTALRPDLKVNITVPTSPDLLPVLFTQNKYLHNKK
jgi:hypothetical protein